MLRQMEDHELFALWIRFSDDSVMNPREPRIIKFVYHDNSTPSNVRGRRVFSKQRILFSIPEFEDKYHKTGGDRYDVFYIVKAPENDNINHTIISTSHREGLHENRYRHSISIRFPPVNNEQSFTVRYEVMPDRNERHFYAVVIFSLIGLSIFFTLIGLQIINPIWLSVLKPLEHNLNTLLGGIVTVSVAAIGFMNKPIMIRTRFWFIFPVAISSIGFLLS